MKIKYNNNTPSTMSGFKINPEKETINKCLQYIEQPWSLINSYFKGQNQKGMVRHQIESYNDFVSYQIQKTINMFNPVHIRSTDDYDMDQRNMVKCIYI